MINSEREMQAAHEWIEYWESTRAGQSWIGNEQAAQHIVDLRRQIDEYRKRPAGQAAPDSGDADVGATPRVTPA